MMNSCKHCIAVKKNEIGEQLVLCEFSGNWENVTLGQCFGNCEEQEYSKEYIAQRLSQISVSAYGWHVQNKVCGIDVTEFEQLMQIAAEMIRAQS